jgi:hypothetical protein
MRNVEECSALRVGLWDCIGQTVEVTVSSHDSLREADKHLLVYLFFLYLTMLSLSQSMYRQLQGY